MDRTTELAALAQAGGASTGLAVLCRMLAEQGILSGPQVEVIRQFGLQGFDAVGKAANAEERANLGAARSILDDLWHKAVLAADRPKPA